MSQFGTFETWRPALTMSVSRPEVMADDQNDATDSDGHRSDACSYSRPNQEALFSHAADAISVLVGEN
jgi:hypothetical protein